MHQGGELVKWFGGETWRRINKMDSDVAFLRMVNRCLLEQLRRERTLREAERTLRGR